MKRRQPELKVVDIKASIHTLAAQPANLPATKSEGAVQTAGKRFASYGEFDQLAGDMDRAQSWLDHAETLFRKSYDRFSRGDIETGGGHAKAVA